MIILDFNKKLIILIIVLILLNISAVSSTNTQYNNTSHSNDCLNQINEQSNNTLSSPENEKPDYPDLIDENSNYITSSNINNYFKQNVLNERYSGKNLIFNGDFENIGQLKIDSNDISITGINANLKNTVFKLTGNNITLKNLNFNLDTSIKDNKGAVILIGGNDIILNNITINYIVPKDDEAYVIFADGYNLDPMENLKVINSSVYFEGHNNNVNNYNCAIKLTDTYNALIENNNITTSLPLKDIDYTDIGADLDSAYAYTIGIEHCDGLKFNNNTVISDVNRRPAVEYPTLNCFMICKSDDVIISNNTIYMTDFVTYPGIENYLYGIDIHNLKNLWIVNNSISMITTGGKLALGTAYPIQISGPIEGVNIEYNDLYSFSNGPNIGIYSQCYYGETYLSIKYNKINVTGLAGTHDWALVTGIESQDTFAEIFNNQIEVHSIADVGVNDNLYAISYRQSINGPNTFDIENNIAISDGYYAVYILNSEYSSIINNTLISSNDNVKTGDDAYRQGVRNHNGEEYYDNRVIRAVDYYSSRNIIDNGNVIEIEGFGDSNNFNINHISARPQSTSIMSNPLISGFKDLSGISQNNNVPNGYIDDNTYQNEITEYNEHNAATENNNVYYDGNGDVEVVNNQGNNLKHLSNSSSSSSIGISNNPLSSSQVSSSTGESKSVSKKAYELDEMIQKEKFIPSVFFIIFIMVLLIFGYIHKRHSIN